MFPNAPLDLFKSPLQFCFLKSRKEKKKLRNKAATSTEERAELVMDDGGSVS